jgi:hypothetical protein
MKLILGSLEYLMQPYNFDGLKVFCKSLRKHYDGDCVFFVRNLPSEAMSLLIQHDIKTINKTEYEAQYNIVQFGINATRRVYNYLFLKKNPQYTDIISTDITDVFVQFDPFSTVTSGNAQIAEEAKLIKECKINAGWISGNYGEQDFERLASKPILCAGIIRADNENTKTVSKLFVQEVQNLYWRSQGTKFGNLDQAHIEYIFHTNAFNQEILPYLNDSFVHIGHTLPEDLVIDTNTNQIKINNKIPALVHQYNRHKNVESFLYELYD